MKIYVFIPILVLLMIGVAFATYYVTDHIETKEEFTIDFDFNIVKEGMGFNLDRDKMHFGSFSDSGASSVRTISLQNNNSFKEKVQFYVNIENHTGVSHWLNIDPPTGTLIDVNEKVDFKLEMDVPVGTPTGLYNGVIYIKITKAWPWDKTPIIYGELEGCYSENTYEMFACGKRIWSCPYRE